MHRAISDSRYRICRLVLVTRGYYVLTSGRSSQFDGILNLFQFVIIALRKTHRGLDIRVPQRFGGLK